MAKVNEQLPLVRTADGHRADLLGEMFSMGRAMWLVRSTEAVGKAKYALQ
jgi:hypothetical protein